MNEAINNKYRKQKRCTHFLMCFCLISLLITAAAPVYSLDITLTGEQHFYTDQDNRVYGEGEEPDPEDIEEYKQQSQTLTASAFHDFDTTENEFSFSAGLSYQTDDLYSPSQGGMYYSGYFRLEEGGLQFSRQFTGYDFDFSAGRITPDRIIESPYSLYLSSHGNSTIAADMQISSGVFFYRSLWLQLNKDSLAEAVPLNEYETSPPSQEPFNVGFNKGYPDRGANLRYYGVQFDSLRFGFLDAAVYAGESFDLEYFINPLPGVLIQYGRFSRGHPWLSGRNENYLFGLFFDYEQPDYYLYSQVFFDDVNTNFLFSDKEFTNPNKLAWSFGGTAVSSWGEFGLYHAGASEYMFQPTADSGGVPYGYTHYPDVLFLKYDQGLANSSSSVSAGIPLEENYLGYVHGENNIAFMLTYDAHSRNYNQSTTYLSGLFASLDLQAALEFVLSGSKSPVNPWGIRSSYKDASEDLGYISMLSQRPLEKRLQFYLDTRKEFDHGFSLFSSLQLGYVWNKLQLEPVYTGVIEYDSSTGDSPSPEYDIQYLYYYKPSDDISEPIAQITIGLEYSFDPEDIVLQ